jgi:hypothetical protein
MGGSLPPPLVRPLQIYAFDPSLGRRHGNHAHITVSYEPLDAGPRGRRVEVIDYDGSNGCYYRPVNLEDPRVLIAGGLAPSESDPRFHQQMVYAVVAKTMDAFQKALGRPVEWRRRGRRRNGPPRLRVYPHAMQEANAYYDADLHALLFGYFAAADAPGGLNLHGQTVFSCLSHDIVAHETTHAIVHDVRRFFMHPSGPDTLAFHEAFADIVALLQHFTFTEAVVDHILGTGGALFRPELTPLVARVAPSALDQPGGGRPSTMAEEAQRNVLVGLAQQFGEAMGLRAALRSALGSPADPAEIDRRFEAHERGAILVAAVFDAFFTVYTQRMADLFRIARVSAGGEITVDLANRLATEAAKTARQFLTMCIRALDYTPPVDISFGDFLRAIITADYDLVRDDDLGYRDIVIEAFRRRGIRPQEVASYSESSLRWDPPLQPAGDVIVGPALDFDLIRTTTPAAMRRNARRLHAFAKENLAALRLKAPGPSGYPKVSVWSFHPLSRVGPDGQLRHQIVAELLQQEVDPATGWKHRGGTTVVIDARTGVVEHAIYKRLDSDRGARREREREYRERLRLMAADAYAIESDGRNFRVDFAAVHRGF